MTYHLSPTGIYQTHIPIANRDDEYDQAGFNTLWDMQERHFWCRSLSDRPYESGLGE